MKKSSTPSTALALSLSDLDEQIATGHRLVTEGATQAREIAERAAHNAVMTGLLLQRRRDATPHGEWEKLFINPRSKGDAQMQNTFAFTSQTARNYIAAAEGALARPGLSGAARKRLLAMADADTFPAEPDQKLATDLAQATRGETLRQLYLDLGIIRAAASERSGPQGGAGRTGPQPEPSPADAEREEVDRLLYAIVRPTNELSQAIERGDLVLLSIRRRELMQELCDTWEAHLDTIRPLLK